jgi:hypothetical protein
MPQGVKGEIALIGNDGETLALVEVRTRTVGDAAPLPALPVERDEGKATRGGANGVALSSRTAPEGLSLPFRYADD